MTRVKKGPEAEAGAGDLCEFKASQVGRKGERETGRERGRRGGRGGEREYLDATLSQHLSQEAEHTTDPDSANGVSLV